MSRESEAKLLRIKERRRKRQKRGDDESGGYISARMRLKCTVRPLTVQELTTYLIS
jgi:hypothetical protein